MRGLSGAGPGERRPIAVSSWPIAFRDAVLVAAACAALSIAINAARSDGIPLVRKEPYQLLVPCPETTGEADSVPPDSPLLEDPQVLVIDARSAQEYAQWHVARAINVPFDYLESTPVEVVQSTASSGARAVLVYGDGEDPDSGEQLARELSGKGIRNMHFVSGGAPAIVAGRSKGGEP